MQAKHRAVIYTRSATKGMDTDPTEAQRYAAYDFADKENLEIVKCVDDVGTSGMNHLPIKLRELILWANDNKVQDLIIYSSDRIARSFAGMQEFFELLEQTTITLRLAAHYLPENPEEMRDAILLQSFVAQVSNRERAKHIRKLKGNTPKHDSSKKLPQDNSDAS